MPGRDPLVYYICIGKFPVSEIPLDRKVKFNYPVYVLLLATIVVHAFAGIRLRDRCYKTQLRPKIFGMNFYIQIWDKVSP
jgi:hypothetical protein